MSVKDKDFGWQKVLIESSLLALKPYVQVGIQGESALAQKENNAKATVVDIATFHEFGAPNANIPERSFMRSTYDKKEKTYLEILAGFKDRILNPRDNLSVNKALRILGEKMKLDIQKTIREGLNPPWAASTREARIKKSSGAIIAETPLIDTGQMLRSIHYKVEDKS